MPISVLLFFYALRHNILLTAAIMGGIYLCGTIMAEVERRGSNYVAKQMGWGGVRYFGTLGCLYSALIKRLMGHFAHLRLVTFRPLSPNPETRRLGDIRFAYLRPHWSNRLRLLTVEYTPFLLMLGIAMTAGKFLMDTYQLSEGISFWQFFLMTLISVLLFSFCSPTTARMGRKIFGEGESKGLWGEMLGTLLILCGGLGLVMTLLLWQALAPQVIFNKELLMPLMAFALLVLLFHLLISALAWLWGRLGY